MPRVREVAWLGALLRRSDVRLVTLLGPGGTGKTRLAIQVASTLFTHFIDGIFFVDLAPFAEPETVLPTVIHTLGLQEDSTETAIERLKQYLHHRKILLILDNFEHVDAAAPLVATLLANSSLLTVLTTSRSALRLVGEHQFPVPPLLPPDLAHLPGIEVLATNPAVALFMQQAQTVKPDFHLDKANAPAIAEICARLDGLPLAIELAAARIKLLTPQRMVGLLAKPLTLLTTGPRDLPVRQQTMRATIEWSYSLLGAQEQVLFRRLAVFAGGCTLEAAGAICFESKDVTIEVDEAESLEATSPDTLHVLERLAPLVEKNLLVCIEQEDGEPRFKMLKLLQEYAIEQLEASGDATRIRQRHLTYYLALAEEAEPKLTSHEQLIWLSRLEMEHDNLRAALANSSTLAAGPELGLRLASALWWFWFVRGYSSEWSTWMMPLLAQTDTKTPITTGSHLRATAMYRLAFLLSQWNDYSLAKEMAEESLRMAHVTADISCQGWAHYILSDIAISQESYEQAGFHLDESLRQFRVVDDRRGICWSFYKLCWLYLTKGDYTRAASYCEAGLAEARAMGDRYNISIGFYGLGGIAQAQENFSQSDDYYIKSLHYSRIVDGRLLILATVVSLAFTMQRKGDYANAQTKFVEGLLLAEKLGVPSLIAGSLAGLAAYAKVNKHLFLAAQIYGSAVSQYENFTREVDPVERAYYEGILADTRAELGEQAFAEAWKAGSLLTPAQAVALLNAVVGQTPAPSPMPESPVPGTLPAGLSQREADVLRLLAQGLTNAEMAERLIVSPFTVNAHLRNIYNKIGTSSRREAILFAREHHLV